MTILEWTKASRLGEFLNEGDWHIIGSFTILPQRVLNNGNGNFTIIPEQIIGIKRGENIDFCYFCHTAIQQHITFKDNISGREINIGNVCVDKLGDALDDRELLIYKGLESLKNKVVREFKKNIHRKDLIEFLDSGIPQWQKARNDKIDKLLKINSKAYYNPPTKIIIRNGKQFELSTTPFEQKDGSKSREYADRNPIKVLRDSFDQMGWNVKPLLAEFEKLIREEGFNVQIPKPRRLTKDELDVLAKEIQINTTEYLKSKVDKNE